MWQLLLQGVEMSASFEFSKSVATALAFAMASLPKKQVGTLILRKIEAGDLTRMYPNDPVADDWRSREVNFTFIDAIGCFRGYDRHLTIQVKLEELSDVDGWGVVRIVRVGDVSGRRVVSPRRILKLKDGESHLLVRGLSDKEDNPT